MVSNNIREEIRRQVEQTVGEASTTVQNVTVESEITRQAIARIEAVESELASLKESLTKESNQASAPEFNYHTRGTYEGNEVKFALQGEVLTPQDAALYGDVNYIEFGGEGGGGDYAFKLFVTATNATPPQPRIGVVYGEVNKVAPTNIDSLFSPANNGLLWLRVVFEAGGSFQSSSIQTGPSLPTNTTTSLHVLIGRVLLQNNVYTIDRQALLGDVIVRRQDVCVDGEPYVDFAFVGNVQPIENP